MSSRLNQLFCDLYDQDFGLKEGADFFVVNYNRVNVDKMSNFRQSLFEVGAKCRVVRKRVFSKLLSQRDFEMEEVLKHIEDGGVGVIFSVEDPVEVAKVLKGFFKEEAFQYCVGVVENTIIHTGDFEFFASLPPKPVLLSQLLGTMVAPIQGFMSVVNGVPRGMATVLDAIRKKKEEE